MMAQLRFENHETPEEFCEILEKFNVALPLEPSPDDLGAVVDAQGRDVFTIDVNRERDDVEVLGIVAHLCMAINTCGGFKAIAAVVDEPEEAGAA